MTTRHATSLTNGEIVEENDLGSIRRVTADTLLILSGISIKRIVINPGAMRTPPRVEGFVHVLAAHSRKTACANLIGIRSPLKWAMCTQVRRV